jgi:dolichyl-phosphate-mannose-protein mannosyltransferase
LILLDIDNAFITQSRLILLDGMLLCFGVSCAYTWIKFYKERFHAFTPRWWFWLTGCGVSLGLVLGVKMVGLFMVGTIGIAVVIDLWKILDIKRGLTNVSVGFLRRGRTNGLSFPI